MRPRIDGTSSEGARHDEHEPGDELVAKGLPVVGVEGTRSVLDETIPLNRLIARAHGAS